MPVLPNTFAADENGPKQLDLNPDLVTPHLLTHQYDGQVHVTFRERVAGFYMTPDEARLLARSLLTLAEEAEEELLDQQFTINPKT